MKRLAKLDFGMALQAVVMAAIVAACIAYSTGMYP